jgi:hypothetical protein
VEKTGRNEFARDILGVEHLAIQRRRGAGLRRAQLLVDRTQQRPSQIHIEARLMLLLRPENRAAAETDQKAKRPPIVGARLLL